MAWVEHRERLEAEAPLHVAESGTCVRPTRVFQFESTGREQWKPGQVHTEDGRDYLLQPKRISQRHVTVKTSGNDELEEVEDVGGSMSSNYPTQFIATKQTLREGGESPPAYFLTILAKPVSKTGIAQLVGRILRQSFARKTGVPWLDDTQARAWAPSP